MSERLPKSDRRFELEQRIVGRVGNSALRIEIDVPPSAEFPNIDKYERLALGFYGSFLSSIFKSIPDNPEEIVFQRFNLAKGDGPKHGYLVNGRAINHIIQAYLGFCESSASPTDKTELVGLLNSPKTYQDIISRLANIPGDFCKPQESIFGLSSISYSQFHNTGLRSPFVIERDSYSGELYVLPDATLESEADLLVDWSALPDQSDNLRCPASKVLLPGLWSAMVEYAATNPEYIDADLKIA